MHSKAYIEAKKEFINCLAMSIVGIGIPLIYAFRDWLPIMRAEKKKEALAAKAESEAASA